MPVETKIHRHQKDSPWTYAMLDAAQRVAAEKVRSGGSGTLFLSEVAPVVTLGRRTEPGDLPFGKEWLETQGIAVQMTDRGGLATYHGPGQWILFAVESLEKLTGDSRGVRKAVDALLKIGRQVVESYGVSARIGEGCEQGVWISGGKLAAVGVHVEQRVLLHGLSFNAFATPQSFQGIRPCGLDAPVSYLFQNETGASETDPEKRERQFMDLGKRLEREALALLWPEKKL